MRVFICSGKKKLEIEINFFNYLVSVLVEDDSTESGSMALARCLGFLISFMVFSLTTVAVGILLSTVFCCVTGTVVDSCFVLSMLDESARVAIGELIKILEPCAPAAELILRLSDDEEAALAAVDGFS